MSSAKLAQQEGGAQTLVSTATVALREVSSGREVVQAATGVGPVDASFRAMLAIVDRPVSLTHYVVTKIEGGSGPDAPGNDALASVVTHIKTGAPSDAKISSQDGPQLDKAGSGLGGVKGDITFTGTGTSTDIIVASARAYISAINRAIAHQGKL